MLRPASVTRLTSSQMIQLNPLVINHVPCRAPASAPPDEFHAVWYELTDRISYLPGVRGNVSYKACFHDLPRGLQTHVYAPAGLEIKEKWTIGGNEAGEEREVLELGMHTVPREGLYLREDVDMHCNLLLTNFVKKNLKKAHSVLVDRLVVRTDLAEETRSRSRYSDPVHRNTGSSIHSGSSGFGENSTSPTTSGPQISEMPGSEVSQWPRPYNPYAPHTPNSAGLESPGLTADQSSNRSSNIYIAYDPTTGQTQGAPVYASPHPSPMYPPSHYGGSPPPPPGYRESMYRPESVAYLPSTAYRPGSAAGPPSQHQQHSPPPLPPQPMYYQHHQHQAHQHQHQQQHQQRHNSIAELPAHPHPEPVTEYRRDSSQPPPLVSSPVPQVDEKGAVKTPPIPARALGRHTPYDGMV